MKYIILTALMLNYILCAGQEYFEGQVNFDKSYESFHSNISIEKLEELYGKWMIGFVQEKRYMVCAPLNDQDSIKVFYFLESADGYIERTNSDSIIHFKIDQKPGDLLKSERIEDYKVILGDTCQGFLIEYIPNDQFFERVEATYYFNTRHKLNPKYYRKHHESFWNVFVENTRSISVRNEIINYPYYKTIYQAVEIQEKKIDNSYFDLNPKKIIVEGNMNK